MDTKKFKIKGAEKAKGGKFLNHRFVAAAGAATIGGFSAGAGYAVVTGAGKSEEPNKQPVTDETVQQAAAPTTAEAAQAEPQQAPAAQTQQSADEYQPTDSSHPSDTPQQPPTEEQPAPESQPVTGQDDVDPNLVAEAIAHEVDQQDIDGENVLTIDQIGTVNGPDGNEIMAVVGHLPDGTQLLLTDIDGDGIFSDVFDMAGNYAGMLEGNLTAGDLIEMYDDTGNYLAMTEETAGDDPVNGITNTEPAHEENSLAQQEQATGEQPSDEELLAQLTDEIGDDNSLLDRLIDEIPENAMGLTILPPEDEDESGEDEQNSEDDSETETCGGTEDE